MPTGGVYRISAYSEEVDELAYELLDQLDWHGLACIEYVEDAETGEWKFLELNPRVWLSLPEAVRAGVDFPYYYWLRARGQPESIDADYETGLACHVSYGEIKHLLSILRDESPFREPPSFARTLWGVTRSCLTSPRFDYIRSDDPRFLLSAIRASVGINRDGLYESGGSTSEPQSTARRPPSETHP